MSIRGIVDEKGISYPKLEHVFLGTVKTSKISGYHCDDPNGDEKVYAEVHLYPKSRRKITVNKNLKLFEAIVKEKITARIKNENNGKSTFFPENWKRQEVVDCIDRVIKNPKNRIKDFQGCKRVQALQILRDPNTHMIIVSNRAGYFPLLKY